MQIQNWRKIKFLTKERKLCNIGNPLLIRCGGTEITLQQIWRNSADFALVRSVFLHANATDQSKFLHKVLNSLVIQRDFSVVQFHCDAPIAVSSLVFVIDCDDFCFCIFILIISVHSLQMIVESCTRQMSD